MAWLFTQVWLWSLAAFTLGVLITWLLFVRPANRKLRAALAERPPEQVPVAPVPEEKPEPPAERTALDLLVPAEQPTDEPTIGDWDRTPRAWSPRPPEPPAPPTPEWDVAQRRPEPPQPVPAPRPVDDSELRVEDQRERQEQRRPQPPVPAKEPEPLEPDPASNGGSASTWFQKAETDDVPETPARSLFEPLDADDELPPAPKPPLATEETQNIPRIEEPAEDAEMTPLPRRTPGAGPRPGAQNLNGSKARKADESGKAGAPVSAGEPNNAGEPGKAGDSGEREGYTIKGHFASRQYHTPDSPQYDRIVAEVWFRTPADAEQAGFEPWDGRGRT